LDLTFEDFDALRQLIYQQSGIWLSDRKTTFLQVRLGERLRALNISSAREYYHFLKYDPSSRVEMSNLIDAVSVNETWFFRETTPVIAWFENILPDLLKASNRVQIWSAGCATGEEPYTLALLLLDSVHQLSNGYAKIRATDISQRALEIARNGAFDPHSLRHTEQRWLSKYFQPSQDGLMAIGQPARSLVTFEQANLVDPDLPRRVGRMDVILCRNVIIYFDQGSRKIALRNFFEILKPGGYLILGHSESLAHTATPFELARVGGSLIYWKPV